MARTKEQNDRRYLLARLGERLGVSPEAGDVHLELLKVLVPLYPDATDAILQAADAAETAAEVAAASSSSPAGEIAPAPEAG